MKAKGLMFVNMALIICYLSCQPNSNNSQFKKLSAYNSEISDGLLLPKEGKVVIVMVPLETCSSCVNYALEYANKNKNRPYLKFIFFAQGSIKKIYQHFTKQELSKTSNIFYDKNSEIIEYGLADEYAVEILFIEDHDIAKVMTLKANNSAEVEKAINSFIST